MDWLRRFWATTPNPHLLTGTRYGALTALVGLSLVLFLTALVWRASPDLLLVPPVAASALIVFALHDSAFAHPWAVFGGSMVSALIGLLCGQLIPVPLGAVLLAVPLSLAAMLHLRCLHPPAGTQALVFALGAGAQFEGGAASALGHLAINLLALVLAGVMVNNLVPGRQYPRLAPASPQGTGDQMPMRRTGLSDEDIRQALDSLGRNLDISEDDLAEVFDAATAHAFQRGADLCCRDIMARDVVSVTFDTPLDEAWSLFARHAIRAMPVVDRERRVLGVLTRVDFLGPLHGAEGRGLAGKLKDWLKAQPPTPRGLPETVGEIMSQDLFLARSDMPVLGLVERLCRGGKHHIPVVDERHRLCGMITQSDLLAALYHRQAWRARRDLPDQG